MRDEEKMIFFGMIIIIIGILIKIMSEFLTFIIVIIGGYFIIKGLINMDKKKKKGR